MSNKLYYYNIRLFNSTSCTGTYLNGSSSLRFYLKFRMPASVCIFDLIVTKSMIHYLICSNKVLFYKNAFYNHNLEVFKSRTC